MNHEKFPPFKSKFDRKLAFPKLILLKEDKPKLPAYGNLQSVGPKIYTKVPAKVRLFGCTKSNTLLQQ